MPQRVDVLRKQAAEFRKLAVTFSSPDMRERLLLLAQQCERVAIEIERALTAGQRP